MWYVNEDLANYGPPNVSDIRDLSDVQPSTDEDDVEEFMTNMNLGRTVAGNSGPARGEGDAGMNENEGEGNPGADDGEGNP
jgi:hypothetical protein